MHLTIDGQQRQLVPIQQFRDEHGLPADFGVAQFAPKDSSGLGTLDMADDALRELRQTMLDAVPSSVLRGDLLRTFDELTGLFRIKLHEVNDRIGLRPVEVDFAAGGFNDVCQTVAYHVLPQRGTPRLDFDRVYDEWLDSTVRVMGRSFSYTHGNETWDTCIIQTAYGRVGLVVDMGETKVFVRDTALACPADQYMRGLLQGVVTRAITALA